MRTTGTASELIPGLLEAFKIDPDKRWELKEYHEKRSLSQNAYYWVLAAQMADLMKMSKAEIHNRNISQYGYPMIIEGQLARVPIPETDEAEGKMLRMTTVHMRPTSQTVTLKDGVLYRTYVIMRGSSDLNAKEMAHFIDMVEQDARSLGIDTATPDERRRMLELQERQESKNRNPAPGEEAGRGKG